MNLCSNNNNVNGGPPPRGFMRLNTEDVKRICEETLSKIKSKREKERKRILKEILDAKLHSWSFFWRFLGFSRPTEEDALREYRIEPSPLVNSPHFVVSRLYGHKEAACKRYLNMLSSLNVASIVMNVNEIESIQFVGDDDYVRDYMDECFDE